MNKKLFLAPMLVAFSLMFGACTKSDTNNSLADPVNNQVTANKNSADVNKQSGGQVTIIAGADKNMVKVRSTGFRWPTCLKRVVDALKNKPGVAEVTPNIEAQPLTVTVRFDGQKTNAQEIGEIAKEATETDPKITSPVTLVYEEEK